jgi:SAM-dependent methyltransferase
MNCYKNQPLRVQNGIPVFNEHDYYIENYDLISGDHLEHFLKTGANPFMDEDHWGEIENSTEYLIRKYAETSSFKILDVGVGMGRLLERFPDAEKYGVDISMGYLSYAKAKGIEVCMSKIENLPYFEEYFDLIVSTDVLEHVVDLNLVLSKILFCLKNGGVFILRVPYKEDLRHYLKEGYPYDLVHLRNFDEYNLVMLFTKIFKCTVLEYSLTGYQGGKIKYFSDWKFINYFITKVLRLLKRLNKPSYECLSRLICEPVEINFVVRKSS